MRDERGEPKRDADAKPIDGRAARTIKQRISRRAALSESGIRELQLQARVLIADAAELKAALAALRRLHRTFRKHASSGIALSIFPRIVRLTSAVQGLR